MQVLFFGTPAFAVLSLKALHRHGHHVVGVVTRPNRPQGRGLQVVEPPPVAHAARDLGLRVLQPESATDPLLHDQMLALHPEAIVIAAYGQILPEKLLGIAPLGAWNVHPSLLPRWRGPAPIQRAIWAGEEETGVTIMKVTVKVDSGPIARQERTRIGPRETRGELEERLSFFGADLLVTVINDLASGQVTTTDQDDNAATYAGRFEQDDIALNWTLTSAQLDRLVRALDPVPGAHFKLADERVKVRDVQPVPHHTADAPGTLVERIPRGAWRVACASGSLWIGSVQAEGKSWMSMDAFLAGRRMRPGNLLE